MSVLKKTDRSNYKRVPSLNPDHQKKYSEKNQKRLQ